MEKQTLKPNYSITRFKSIAPISDKPGFIIKAVCKEMQLTFTEINTPRKKGDYVLCRQLCHYYLHYYTNLSLKRIGSMFVGRNGNGYDHSSIIHSRDLINDYREIKDASIYLQCINLDAIFLSAGLKKTPRNANEIVKQHKEMSLRGERI